MKYQVPVEVKSSFSDAPGTWVVREDEALESTVVRGVALDKAEARVMLVGVDDKPGVVAKIFGALSDQHIAVDMIIQSPSRHATDRDGPTVDVTFTVTRADVARTKVIIGEILSSVGGTSAEYDENVVKVSIVGLGMRSHAGVAAKMFALLAKEGVNIQAISTSEIKVSCLVESKYAELSVRALHDGFELGA